MNSADDTQTGAPARAATQLLQAGRVTDRVRDAVNARIHAMAEAWIALAILVFGVAFLVIMRGAPSTSFYGQDPDATGGLNFIFLLMAGFFAASSLERGLGDRTSAKPRQRTPHARRYDRVVTGSTFLALGIIVWLGLAAGDLPWPLALLVTVLAATPLGVLATRSALRARDAGVRRPAPNLIGALSPTACTATAVLAVWLGTIAALAGQTPQIPSLIANIIFLTGMMASYGSRWGMQRLAEEWGRTQWIAFGCSYLLINGLAVVLAFAPAQHGLISIVGGILVAAPLVVAAFLPAPIWDTEPWEAA